MTGGDLDLFVEPRLRFEIRKPRPWSFMPPAWSPAVQLTYRRKMGSMWVWGRISLISGWLAGLSLFVAFVLYVGAVWGILGLFLPSP